MENLETQERVISLGKKLIASLELPERDEITEWMINYISEQITIAESNDRCISQSAKQRCLETILKLWEYRAQLPNGARPFDNFDGVFSALNSLDPGNVSLRYYSPPQGTEPSFSGYAKDWVDIGKSLDRVAKILISFSFSQAAISTLDKESLEWLKLINGTVDSPEANAIWKILDENPTATEIKEDSKEVFEQRIKQLQFFEDLSCQLRGEMELKVTEFTDN